MLHSGIGTNFAALPRAYRLWNNEAVIKVTRWLSILFLTVPLASQADFWSKTIIEDRGHFEKSKVESKKICDEVVGEELALQKRFIPDFSGKIEVKSHAPLEVYRTDGSFGYAAKCVLDIRTKNDPPEAKLLEVKAEPEKEVSEENLSDDSKLIDE